MLSCSTHTCTRSTAVVCPGSINWRLKETTRWHVTEKRARAQRRERTTTMAVCMAAGEDDSLKEWKPEQKRESRYLPNKARVAGAWEHEGHGQ